MDKFSETSMGLCMPKVNIVHADLLPTKWFDILMLSEFDQVDKATYKTQGVIMYTQFFRMNVHTYIIYKRVV